MLFLSIIAVAVFGALGDIVTNQWVKTDLFRWWLLALPVWMVVTTVFGIVLRQKHYSFSVAVIIILLVHSGIVLVLDIFSERAVLTPMQWVGVVTGVAAIVLLEIGRK